MAEPEIRTCKYPLKIREVETQTIDLPAGCRYLCVREQAGEAVLYASILMASLHERCIPRYFVFVPTGGRVPLGATYIGTVQLDWCVAHVYEDSERTWAEFEKQERERLTREARG